MVSKNAKVTFKLNIIFSQNIKMFISLTAKFVYARFPELADHDKNIVQSKMLFMKF